jgi:hypothetical protein
MPSDDPDAVLSALREREPLLHREPAGAVRDRLGALITDDFWEVGASGRVYGREEVLDAVVARESDAPGAWVLEELAVRPLGGDAWLATYLLHQGRRITRRATVWRHDGERWVALYHQGTLVPDA